MAAGGVRVSLLISVFPPALVDRVIEHAHARELRKRSLPARLVVYFTLAMWLFAGYGYDTVPRNLVEGLAWTPTGWGDWRIPSSGSITKARARLGPGPLELLFRAVAGHPTGTDDHQGAYPQVSLVALAECGTRALIDAALGSYTTGEQDLARTLAPSMTADMLVLADRNFPRGPMWTAATAGGAQLLWRVKTNQFSLPVEQALPDGTTSAGRSRPCSTRSKPPNAAVWPRICVATARRGVRQEIWAMLCVYQALRSLMATTAHAVDTPPLRISFTRAPHVAAVFDRHPLRQPRRRGGRPERDDSPVTAVGACAGRRTVNCQLPGCGFAGAPIHAHCGDRSVPGRLSCVVDGSRSWPRSSPWAPSVSR
jgi:hypothetical protein